MVNIIPSASLHPIGVYLMYTPFDEEDYSPLLLQCNGVNIRVIRYEDVPVEELVNLTAGGKVSAPVYSLNDANTVSFLDNKADYFTSFVDILVKNRQLVTSEEELLNFMLDLKALGFKSKKIIQVLNRILTEQFVELLNVWKNKPDILKSKFLKVMGT